MSAGSEGSTMGTASSRHKRLLRLTCKQGQQCKLAKQHKPRKRHKQQDQAPNDASCKQRKRRKWQSTSFWSGNCESQPSTRAPREFYGTFTL